MSYMSSERSEYHGGKIYELSTSPQISRLWVKGQSLDPGRLNSYAGGVLTNGQLSCSSIGKFNPGICIWECFWGGIGPTSWPISITQNCSNTGWQLQATPIWVISSLKRAAKFYPCQ